MGELFASSLCRQTVELPKVFLNIKEMIFSVYIGEYKKRRLFTYI